MRALWLTFAVLIGDQIAKTLIVHRMRLYESISIVGDWMKLTYTTNPGMAFGMTFGPPGLITVFALAATALIVYYLWRIRGTYQPYQDSLALILGGALGNILDRIFYGVIYDYGGLFTGQVVDFIHIDIGLVAIPLLGPRRLFPIWNVADMAIVVGVIGFMIFQGGFHRRLTEHSEAQRSDVPQGEPAIEPGSGFQGERVPVTPTTSVAGPESP